MKSGLDNENWEFLYKPVSIEQLREAELERLDEYEATLAATFAYTDIDHCEWHLCREPRRGPFVELPDGQTLCRYCYRTEILGMDPLEAAD